MLIFLGKLTYPPYATNELFAVIFSNNMQQGEKVAVVHQWTKDAAGQAKANSFAQGTVDKAVITSTGEKEIEFFYGERETTYYWYKGTQSGSKLTLSMFNKSGEEVVKKIELLATYY
ncbi:uncharacterized protein BO88DRAFT_481732 [Aspergillus vadensis CBS 113365]|uniref:Uncharacterized protein n=2 Tax=Aspergillus subgen. Circumdati TaxID=2720871 RepID=A0A1L9MY22_ASPTC|nr:hypothetical protein BO88DRAFT_481732 [Aspergillus vadensis CBS 113365]OJI81782.1 hypothetical protein ASPTUDRAFT_202827 [Aspergillus tubingensis CBS 134.48]PYH70124.1 hypothetical protein BO88DRAFT_481732 [Aspergillus vadensis CBS 113365]GLA59085.1 hypothetical protein AtubIFM54640_009817 [Aspergillus tubingensis]